MDDPLLPLVPTRSLESNNELRAVMVADHVLPMATTLRYADAREKIQELVLQHIQWAQREAIVKHASHFVTPAEVRQQMVLVDEISGRLAAAIAGGEIDP